MKKIRKLVVGEISIVSQSFGISTTDTRGAESRSGFRAGQSQFQMYFHNNYKYVINLYANRRYFYLGNKKSPRDGATSIYKTKMNYCL